MKNIYEIPELNVTLFYTNDVLTQSDNDIDAGGTGWFDGVDGTLESVQ